MRYVRNIDNSSYVGEIADNVEIPSGFVEITREEYMRTQLNALALDDIDDDDVT